MSRMLSTRAPRVVLLFGLLIGALLVAQSPAEAVSIRLFDGVTTITCADGAACDTNAAVGAVTFNGAIGTWIVNVTTAVTYPVLGSQTGAILDLNSVNLTSAAGGTLTIWASEINYIAPAAPTNVGFDLDVGGTTAGSVSFAAWADDGNTLFNQATSLGSIAFATSPYSGTFSGSALLSGFYSLTSRAIITHLNAGATSFDAELSQVPEPTALSLFGLGLIGLAAVGRKRAAVTA